MHCSLYFLGGVAFIVGVVKVVITLAVFLGVAFSGVAFLVCVFLGVTVGVCIFFLGVSFFPCVIAPLCCLCLLNFHHLFQQMPLLPLISTLLRNLVLIVSPLQSFMVSGITCSST